MSDALTHLVKLLTLEKLDDDLFRGESEDLGFPQVFGGQVIAQSLAAAMQVVNLEQHLHSCHCYFLRAGDSAYPIIYDVNLLKSGSSFTVVNISAKQHNKIICNVMASFHIEEYSVEHQVKMPEVGTVDSFYSENELLHSLSLMLPSPLREKFQADRPFDVRIKYANDPFNGHKLPPEQYLWMKTNGEVNITEQRLQQCLFAYFSDFHCIITALHPHERGFMQPDIKVATLDHSIWFHRTFDLTHWHLYALESNNAFGARGLTRGQFFNANGQLIATTQQEGLIRLLP